MKLLDVDCEGVRFVGIHGIGSVGKTTLAKVVFNQLCLYFDDCCFLGDVRESSEKGGLVNLQKRLYSDILNSRFMDNIHDIDDGMNQIGTRFHSKKVLMQMSLVKIVDGDVLWMHDQLKDLGRQIVQRECLHDPGECSWVWICEEAVDIVRKK
ncbi:disease resistance protein RUN1-like [Eucalyptus grandis]|uniref:disease resistance protein RUN1-like n=1 Tax=Eucalyptus grandis TaxID=71139 RepID=UPI00192EE70E|nr:disease resistance protein RUN1-like [Eucalyptus grandis]